jgi:general secretion pathway protein K
LLNALILVAAISAIAAGLMLRAENSRTRISYLQGSAQAMLYLDAAELLVEPVLRGDWLRDQNVDYLSESWAAHPINAEVDRGTVRGEMRDLQGLFNVNSLSDPGDGSAVQAFEHLLKSLDLPVVLAREIAAFTQPLGRADMKAYSARDLPIRPALQRLDDISELRLVQGMTSEIYARLLPYVWAGPTEVSVNVNTAPRAVLAAIYPAANGSNIDRLIAERNKAYFADMADYNTRLERAIPAAVLANARIPRGGLGVSSQWFEARFTAELNETVLRRRLVIVRDRLTGRSDIIRRIGLY